MMIASAKPPAIALWWWPMPSTGSLTFTQSAKTKMPITIDGKPFSTSSHRRTCSPMRGRRELADVDRASARPNGSAISGRDRDQEERCRRAPARCRRLSGRRRRRALVKKSQLSAPTPRLNDRPDDDREHGDRDHGGGDHAPSSAMRFEHAAGVRERPVALSEIGCRSSISRPSAASSKRLTMRCAAKFVMNVITSRISAR